MRIDEQIVDGGRERVAIESEAGCEARLRIEINAKNPVSLLSKSVGEVEGGSGFAYSPFGVGDDDGGGQIR